MGENLSEMWPNCRAKFYADRRSLGWEICNRTYKNERHSQLSIPPYTTYGGIITRSELDSLRWFYQRRSPTPHFGGAHPGGYDLQGSKFELGRDFCTMRLAQVSLSYVYSFGSYRVDKQTNKQTDAAENI